LAKTKKVQEEEKREEEVAFPVERDDDGRFRAVLPSGKRPLIRPVLAHKIRRIYDEFDQPEVPTRLVEIEGASVAEKFEDPRNPEYQERLTEWYLNVQASLFERFILDALIVPEDDLWAWKLAETGITIPQSGPDRQRAYMEEELEELVTDWIERQSFIDAVRAISVPTEAGIRAARRRFWDEMEGDVSSGNQAAEGEHPD
jgi:hypothetical protein